MKRFRLLPARLRHFEDYIPALKEAQDAVRARGRGDGGRGSLVGDFDFNGTPPPTESKIQKYAK